VLQVREIFRPTGELLQAHQILIADDLEREIAASTSSRRIALISSSGTAAAAAGLSYLRHESGELEDLFDPLGWG